MLLQNDYSGVVEDWVVEMIQGKAKRMGIGDADIDDALQEVVMHVYSRFEHDPARASRRTAMAAVVENRLKMFVRSEARYRRMLEGVAGGETNEEPERGTQLALDVRELFGHMSSEEQDICIALSEGFSANEIAAARNWHPSRVQRAIKRIREIFQYKGMQSWLVA